MTDEPPASEDALHRVLADWLVGRGECSAADAVARHGAEAVLAACEHEGVVSLVHTRLSEGVAGTPVPSGLLEPLALRARRCAARSLLCQAEARRIQQALSAAGIGGLWLKGIALGHWLYPSMHLRDVADIDLLLPDHATTLRAAQVLAPLGYALPNPHIAGDLVVHELLAWSQRAQLELDLHWDLSNAALFADRIAWQALRADAQPLPALGPGAMGLSAAHALVHACIHRAINHLTRRENRLRWLYDIHLLWDGMPADAREHAVLLAVEAGAADATVSALDAVAERFGTVVETMTLDRLRIAAGSEKVGTRRLRRWSYFQWSSWRRLGPVRGLRWVRQLLVPDFAHLQVRYGSDGAGRGRILLRRLGDGVRRWRGYAGRHEAS